MTGDPKPTSSPGQSSTPPLSGPSKVAAAPGAAAPRNTSRTVPLLGCDCFLQALDSMMRRSGQGSHVSQSVVEFDRPPELDILRDAWRSFIQDHPISVARLRRNWFNLIPEWHAPDHVREDDIPPVAAWHEPDAPKNLGEKAQPIDSLADLCRIHMNPGRGKRRPEYLVRLDVLERTDGSAAVVVTWSHQILDGKGVELLLTELANRCEAGDASAAPIAGTLPPTAHNAASLRDSMQRSKAFIQHFQQIIGTRFASLGGPKRTPSTMHCRVATLGEAESARVNERATARTSQLINTPFFFACAARAHDRVFRHRGRKGMPQLITMPVQTRPKGGDGPIFQNHVSILFFRLTPEDLETVESATKSLQKQFAGMMRGRLDAAFSGMQDVLRRVPPRLYMLFLRLQMRGEITSFFHSHTGPFAPNMNRLAGAGVTNAYHLPVISAPPGTGLFINEHGPRICAAMSWRSGSVDAEERQLMFDHFIEDMHGGPIDTLTETLEV